MPSLNKKSYLVCKATKYLGEQGRLNISLSKKGKRYEIISGDALYTPFAKQAKFVVEVVAKSLVEKYPDDWKIVTHA